MYTINSWHLEVLNLLLGQEFVDSNRRRCALVHGVG